MRRAQIEKAWAACRSAVRDHISVSRLVVGDNEASYEVPITSRVIGLIGPNGAGKTRFLRTLTRALEGKELFGGRPDLKAVVGQFRGSEFTVSPGVAAPPDEFNVELIDASMEAHAIQTFVSRQSDLPDLLDQVGFREVLGEELERYRYGCMRAYSAISVAEIEGPSSPSSSEGDVDDEENVIPFFRVAYEGAMYDTTTMGFGELCTCYILWRAQRLRTGSALLLDEPDSHLSPSCRKALLDLLALISEERKLWTVFTSHSIESMGSMAENETLLIHQTHGEIPRLALASNKRATIRALGLAPSKRLLVCVEDVDGLEVARQVVSRWGQDFVGVVDIQIIGNGAGGVSRFVELFPEHSRICRAVAILDGDQRAEYGGRQRVFFFPGGVDPIRSAREHVRHELENLASQLGVPPDALRNAMANIDHLNYHDFCRALAEHPSFVDVPVPAIRSAVIRTWITSPEVAPDAEAIARDLAALIDQIGLDP